MKISVLIATNREYTEAYAGQAVASLHKHPYPDMEIVVCSPKNYNLPDCVWVEDKVNDGAVAGYQQAYEKSTGDIIQILTDDYIVRDIWWTIAEEIAVQDKCIGSLAWSGYSPYFPTLKREIIEGDLFGGYMLNPAYYQSQADNDLGRYCQFHHFSNVRKVNCCVSSNPNPPEGDNRSHYGAIGDAIFNFFWGTKAGQYNQHLRLNAEMIKILGERIRHPACLRRLEKIT
jgi:hypothetical protein